ncbi:hypothetical protein J6590_023945 [Homalodisca vitripennis]|nr:hypothetical protein J6590_023945 [Homalodisca vitripennis]
MLQFEPHWRVSVVGGRGFVPRGVSVCCEPLRGNMRQGYRGPYIRGGRHGGGGRMHGYREIDRNSGGPPGAIDDPLSAFEKILREKDMARERHRRRKRSFSRSPSPRPRSRSRSRSPPLHRKRGSVTPSPPARQRSPTPPLPRRSPSPPPRSRSPRTKPRTSTRSRSKTRTPRSRTRSRTRSPPPAKRRSPSFTISRLLQSWPPLFTRRYNSDMVVGIPPHGSQQELAPYSSQISCHFGSKRKDPEAVLSPEHPLHVTDISPRVDGMTIASAALFRAETPLKGKHCLQCRQPFRVSHHCHTLTTHILVATSSHWVT